MPSISVIIPVHNVEGHVEACIHSLRRQIMVDFEAIVVDDGSTDLSADIARQAIADDPRFHMIRQENRGLGAARNAGLAVAKGDYIAFLDGDDRLAPDYLFHMHSALEETGADWVACGVRYCTPDGGHSDHSAIHGLAGLHHSGRRTRWTLGDWNDVIRHFPSAWNKLYRRSLIDGLQFGEAIWFEDHGFFYRAAARTDHLLHLARPLYLQTRGREGQITSTDDDRVFDQFMVLEDMQAVMSVRGRGGEEVAFEKIASRLLFERSTALRHPQRRTQFAEASARFLADRGLTYRPGWDPHIARCWGIEMSGELPLSVIIPWSGHDLARLSQSLDALARPATPGHEVLVICDTQAVADRVSTLCRDHPQARALVQPGRGPGPARNAGLEAARGRFVCFLDAGHQPVDASLQDWVDSLIRTGAAFSVSAWGAASAGAPIQPGFLPPGPPDGIEIRAPNIGFTPDDAMRIAPHISAMLFDRRFLAINDIRFGAGVLSSWQVILKAALCAPTALYHPWPGSRAPEQAPRARAVGARQIARALDALTASLGEDQANRLPDGWPRRLFARAVRQEVNRPDRPGGRPGKLAFALSATLAAARRGLTSTQTALDPMTGPWLDTLMSIGAIRSRATHRSTAWGSARPLIDHRTPLNAAFGARINFDVNFDDHPYANISFYSSDGIAIPFHLSLRCDDGLAVCNNLIGAGWGREIQRKHVFARGKTSVEILLRPREAVVSLDGRRVFRFEAWHPFSRFNRLAEIASFDCQGGIVSESLQTEAMVPVVSGPDRLQLDDRLEIVAHISDPQAGLTARLEVVGAELDLAPIVDQRDGGCEIRTVLPGRIWQHIDDRADLQIKLMVGGAEPFPPLRLDRQQMARRIDDILSRGALNQDPLAAMQIIEHVRFGQLAPLLTAKARANLNETAAFFAVQSFLPDDAQPVLRPDEAVATSVDPVTVAMTRFNRALADTPGADLLETLLTVIEDQPKAIRREIFLWLAEFFCTPDRDFDLFHALFCTDGHGTGPLPDAADISRTSVLLPFLMAEARIDDLKKALKTLNAPTEHWISTAALARVLRQAAQGETLAEADCESVIYAAIAVIETLAGRYWSRAHCEVLIDAVVLLLRRRDTMTGYLARDVEAFAVRVYALSRPFWQALDKVGDLPPGLKLDRARAAFQTIEGAILSEAMPADIRDVLDHLDALGCYDTVRVRRELAAPQSGQSISWPQGRASDMDWIETEALIRDLARPGAPVPDAATAAKAAQALPVLYPQVAQAPYYDLQIKTSRAIEALLAEAATTAISSARIAEMAPALQRLGQSRSDFLGIGLILTLMRALVRDPEQHMAVAALIELLKTTTASFDDAELEKLAKAALPRLVLQTLRHSQHGTSFYQEVVACLPDLAAGLPVPVALSGSAALSSGSPLYDTIVVVFSCRPNLVTRIPALRDSWLQQLKDIGVPYLVVVGDGDGQVKGDILHLDAPDDYEGLPQKTLAAIRWVYDNTDALHMVKVDDDCFLNPQVFFRSLSYRKFDYYGRVLSRHLGQMDRSWHNGKSTSQRGRFELDKSPEPSTYADGGSGYALSRTGMAAVLDAVQSPEGQRLQRLSFMEDKLLGDLLALRGITPSQLDYRVSLRRRVHAGGQPVAQWVNSFFASRAAPISLVHLDDHVSQQRAMTLLNSTELHPKKIWPSYQDAALVYQSNALELISEESRLALARDAEVAVVSCTRNEMFMLPHFLNHYRKLGVTCFLIADNCSDDGTLEYLMQQPDVVLFSVDTDYSLSQYGVAWQQAMLAAYRVGKWSVVADADELLVWEYPAQQSLRTLLQQPEFSAADAARVFMLDMYPGGNLAEATFTHDPFADAGFVDREPFLVNAVSRGPFSNMPTWTSALRHRLIAGARPDLFVAQKIALLRYKPWMRLSAGMHDVAGANLSERELVFAHFKYNADFHRKVTAEVARAQHFNGAEEYRKYLQVLSEGRDVIFEDGLSVPWTDAPFVQTLLRR